MSDLISRQAVLDYPIRLDHYDEEHGNRVFVLGIESVMEYVESIPSETCDDCIWHTCNYNKIDWDGEDGYISRRDVVNEIHKYFVEEIDKTPTEIDEDGDELYADMPTVNSLLACNKELSKRIKSLPSAEPKTGEWVWSDEDASWMCGACCCVFEEIDWKPNYNYCPNCGAKMGGGAE